MKFQYLNFDHEQDYLEMRRNMPEHYRFNKEFLSVIFLMAGNEELNRKIEPYFDVNKGEFDTLEMFEEQDFSSGLRVLALLAVNLFNANEKVDPLQLMSLDDVNFKLAMNAIILRRHGMSTEYRINAEDF
ncbi:MULTISPECIES: DUF6075 family protein [Bacillus]|uniref:DUF6075 family protein n=1 Tax=Bacillus glycinifermentans TaxID=1664069 RepID=A0A0T6BIL0_9BACI|nr:MULTISPECIES: DUF6075 family protein [Bacillus]MBS4161447.1 hypothetical protein [Klebsiella pneumoniae]KRT87104.1 hypothetical protein AB447_209050 [Bacillus glycinifermentans]MEC0342010.1 DUF6075 family protein [Bacillus sonorensis]MEC0457476.1 DUF6075 family protein [Bacillus sonorensis]MEC0487153.1 DUF6075 family protein [Bacillus glycinifermentans]